MGSLDGNRANAILDGTWGTAAMPSFTGSCHVRLMTTNGSVTANGTELATSGGYTAGTGAPTVTGAAASGQSKASNSAVQVTNMPNTTSTPIVGLELWDSASTPLRWHWGALTASKTTNAGDTFLIPSGSLQTAFA